MAPASSSLDSKHASKADSGTRTRAFRLARSAIVAVVLCVMVIDALPRINRFHSDLKGWIDPAVDVTGTWQGSWNLYAPRPDTLNERLLAVVDYSDGTQQFWVSPDWREKSAVGRFVTFRQLEFYDDVASNATPDILRALADEIVGSVPAPARGVSVAQVTIERLWSDIADPRVEFAPLDGYLEPRNREVLHVEAYQ